MAQAAWADKASTWSADTFLWANTTYEDVATLASDVSTVNTANTLYPSGIILASDVNIISSGGFNLVGHANFDMSAGSTNSNNTIYVNAIEFNADNGFTPVGNLPITASITLGSTVAIPQPGTLNWDAQTETWAAHTGTWGYTPSVITSVTANLTQINLSELHEEDVEKLASAVYALAAGATASGNLVVPVSATLANNQNLKFNINFEESITITGTSNITSSNNFLWNDQEEDTATTWTKVADPDA